MKTEYRFHDTNPPSCTAVYTFENPDDVGSEMFYRWPDGQWYDIMPPPNQPLLPDSTSRHHKLLHNLYDAYIATLLLTT